MAKLTSSQAQETDIHEQEVMESPTLQSTIDSPKKKKKSRKSRAHVSQTPEPEANDAASSPQEEDEQSREKKRKRNSESGQQKKKPKNKNPENGIEGDEPINAAEYDQTTAESELPASKKPRVLTANGSEDDSKNDLVTAKEEPSEDGDLTKKGKPKKPRGPRIGGKNGQRVGFYTKEEVQLLESFKVDFCNHHELSDHKIFDTMVQHSERAPVMDDHNSKLLKEDWPGPEGLKKEDFWAEILAVLPQRDERSLKRFMRRHFQDSTQKPHEWTPEQDEELVNLMTLHPGKFAYVGRLLGRSDDDVTQRWYNQLMHRDKMRRGKWNEEELRSLLDAIQEVWNTVYKNEGDTAGKDMYEIADKHLAWNHISNSMGNVRTRQQCSDKWRKVRKAVENMRAAGNPDAQFDPVASVNKPTRWSMGGSVTPKSQAMVVEEDDEEEANDKKDQAPAASNGLGVMYEGTPGLPLPSESSSEAGEESAPFEAGSPSGNLPSSSSSIENGEASQSKKRKHAGEEQETETKEERKARRKEEREKRKTIDDIAAAIVGASSEAPESSQKEKKKKKKSKKSLDAAGADAAAEEDEVADTPQKKSKKERRSDANGASDDEQAVTESPSKKRKSKKSRHSNEA